MMRTLATVALLFACLGCSSSESPAGGASGSDGGPDAGATDVGVRDGGTDSGITEIFPSDVTKAVAEPATGLPIIPDEVLVYVKDGVNDAAVFAEVKNLGGEVIGRDLDLGLWQLRFADIAAAKAALVGQEWVKVASPNYIESVLDESAEPIYPDDGYCWDGITDGPNCKGGVTDDTPQGWQNKDIFNQTWGLQVIDMPKAWAIETGKTDVVIAVADSPVSVEDELPPFFDSYQPPKTSAPNNHGTAVAGVARAQGNNHIGISGLNWFSRLGAYTALPSSVCGKSGCRASGTTAEEQVALGKAVNAGARVINASFGGDITATDKFVKNESGFRETVCSGRLDAAREEHKAAIAIWREFIRKITKDMGWDGLIVVAAGNSSAPPGLHGLCNPPKTGGEWCVVDAAWSGGLQLMREDFKDNIVIVASVGDGNGCGTYYNDWDWRRLSYYSSAGSLVDVAAPGAKILTLAPGGKVEYQSGTSLAAPFVTGLASLILSKRPELKAKDVKAIILEGAKRGGVKVPGKHEFSVINAWQSLLVVQTWPNIGCVDKDGDGYFDQVSSAPSCVKWDCNDKDASIRPGAPELCDGKDNNCNGQIDEGLVRPCATSCGGGQETCVKGVWTGCTARQPQAETCDGLDNDCNGTPDNGCSCVHGTSQSCYRGPAGTLGIGICVGGTQQCDQGQWGQCSGDVQPAKEICDDGIDNDCNGKIDVQDSASCASAPKEVVLSGAIADQFSYNGGTFKLSVSPLDDQGDLISGRVTRDNFAFTGIGVANSLDPSLLVTSGRATVDGIDITLPSAGGEGMTAVLTFDSSGSMQSNDPGRMRVEAGKAFISRMDVLDRAAIIDFGAGTDNGLRASRLLQSFTGDASSLSNAMDMVLESGSTPFYDSVLDAIDLLVGVGAAENISVLALTDGEDNQSTNSYQAVISTAATAGVRVFPVGLGSGVDFSILREMASGTGGAFAEATDSFQLAQFFDGIGAGLSKGRIVVNGSGVFDPPLQIAGRYVVTGALLTMLGGSITQTPFGFSVDVK